MIFKIFSNTSESMITSISSSFRASSLSCLCVSYEKAGTVMQWSRTQSQSEQVRQIFLWTEITFSAGFRFAAPDSLLSALTFTWLYTCISPCICVYTCRSLYTSCFLPFLWFLGGQREQVFMIQSCNFHVFTFSPASLMSLIPLSPVGAAFSLQLPPHLSFTILLCHHTAPYLSPFAIDTSRSPQLACCKVTTASS